jgi:hypothetical protein
MKTIAVFLSLFGASLTFALGDTEVGSYHATFSKNDFLSSKGAKLSGAAAVIQQDRANYYKFNKRDESDTASASKFFKSAKNRAQIAAMVKRGGINDADIDTDTEYGTLMKVTIMKNSNGEYYLKMTLLAG